MLHIIHRLTHNVLRIIYTVCMDKYGTPRNPSLKALNPDELTQVVRVRGRGLSVHDFASMTAEQRGTWLAQVDDYLADHAPELTLNAWNGRNQRG